MTESGVDGGEFLQNVKDCHSAEKKRRERRESGNPNAYLTADMISEMRNERDEQILSAALGIYERAGKAESEDDMTDSSVDARATEQMTSSAPGLPAADGEIPAEKAGDGWRASPNGFVDATDSGLDRRARMAEWDENVKDLQRRIRARRGDKPPINAATVINELREERIEQIVSAAGRSKGK